MAGIFGIIGDTSKSHLFEKTLLHIENYKSNSILIDKNIFLGITSLTNFSTEILNKDDLVISLNGEYYTDDQDAIFSRDIIFQLYKKYGKNFITRIDGIFNIFIFNKKSRKLLLYNDWAGNHNLFYYHDGRHFIFSTDIKGILKIIDKKTLDKKAAVSQFMFSHLLFDTTLIKEIRLLNPASILEYQDGKINIENYYDLKNHYHIHNNRSNRFYINKLYELFEKPTVKFLKKDKISLPLTGGMDSRFLLHFLMKYNYNITDIFTKRTDKIDDVLIAQKICKKLNLPHRVSEFQPDFYREKFFENYRIHEGFLPPYLYASGCFNEVMDRGYHYIIQYPSINLTLGDLFTPNTKNYIGEYQLNESIKNKIFTKFLKLPEVRINNLFLKPYWQFENVKNDIFSYFGTLKSFPSIFIFDYFAWYQHCRRWSNLGGITGQYIGRIAPTQDRQLVEFCFNLPTRLKYWQFIHKKMFKTKCPTLAKFPREGTGVPISWPEKIQMIFKAYRSIKRSYFSKKIQPYSVDCFYRDHVKSEIEDILISKKFKERNIFNLDYIKKIWNEHLNGENNEYLIHNILNIELFLRNWID